MVVSETETSDKGTGNGAATDDGWAIKRTPNAMKFGRRSVYTIIRPHAKLQPIPRTFLCHLQNNISEVPRARASVVGSERTTERTGGTRTDASFMKTYGCDAHDAMR